MCQYGILKIYQAQKERYPICGPLCMNRVKYTKYSCIFHLILAQNVDAVHSYRIIRHYPSKVQVIYMAIIDIRTHVPQSENVYFFDCNVLMYLHYTNGSYEAAAVYNYSRLITQIIGAHAKILITDVLLSEFINTYIQVEFHRLANINGWPHSKHYFKQHFKLSPDYAIILQEIEYIITRQLFPVCELVDCEFSKFGDHVSTVFGHANTFDFNDRYYAYEMSKYHAFIVSNDADFSDISLCDIITNNQSMLAV